MGDRSTASLVPRRVPQALQGLTIGFIGVGTMGRGLIQGLLAHGVARAKLLASDASADACRVTHRHFKIPVSHDNLRIVRDADVIVLAVKPQHVPALLAQLGPHLSSRHLVVSIAAGIPLRWFRSRLRGVPVVRVMPNLPATVGSGFSVMTCGQGVTARQRRIAQAIFAAVGETCELPERDFDAVTAVSGSGPAYVFFLIQAWEEAARALGLPAVAAERAIRQTLEGATRLLRATGEPASVLIQRVASKGGTTEAALRILTRRRVAAHFVEALQAAARRSKQLSMS